jgi:hypothetical protein
MKHYFLTGEAGHQDKLSDPALQMEPVNVYGKNILNGCVPQNGFLQNSKMNITNNPLAETDEDKVSQTTIFKLLFYFLNSHPTILTIYPFQLQPTPALTMSLLIPLGMYDKKC